MAPERLNEEKIRTLVTGNQLGSGHFGAVHEGQFGYNDDVAIKISKLKSDDRLRDLPQQFENEKMAAENFQHQNIMGLLAYGEDDKHYYLIYDHMPSSLDKKLTDLSWEDTVEILKGIAEGLDHMHQKDYVHGDIKPANVLLTDDNEAKITDFGTLSRIGATRWVNIFTPGYAPPEGNGGPLSDRVDIFSFGIVMLQLLSRNSEFEVLMGKGKSPKKKELHDWAIMELGLKHHAVHKNFKESCNKDTAIALTELAVRCTNSYRNGRPPMSDVVQELNNLASQEIIPDQDIN